MPASAPLNRLNDFYGNTPLLSVEYYYSITNIMENKKKHMFVTYVSQRAVIVAQSSWVACGYAPDY